MPIDDDDDVVTPRSAEAWAMTCALQVEQDHGGRGLTHIAEMIGKFAFEGNQIGLDNWKAIARTYDQLMRAPRGLN